MNPVSIVRGAGPIVLAQPHSGTFLPISIKERLNDLGQTLLDTDWHVPALYDGLLPDATIVRANFSRYVIDANRDPAGVSLYPGQNTTELAPTTTFDGEPIWKTPPSDEDIADRLERYHGPYHLALKGELLRAKQQFGFAILYDCHSIRSIIPHLFEGQLPDLNIGTNDGQSCAPSLISAVENTCQDQSEFTYIVDGRFKGGWTTRHYGKPKDGVHAIQMELSQLSYLESETPPFSYDTQKAERLRQVLSEILNTIRTQSESAFTVEKNCGQTP